MSIELQEQVMTLREEALVVKEENFHLKTENNELKLIIIASRQYLVRQSHSAGKTTLSRKPMFPSTLSCFLSTSSTQSTYPEIAANAALLLITVACSLLDRQLTAQAAAFQKEGGFTERLYRVRTQAHRQPDKQNRKE